MNRFAALATVALSACEVTVVPAFDFPLGGGAGGGSAGGNGGVTALAAAHEATAALRDGELFVWGSGDALYGITGLGPHALGRQGFVAVALGWSVVCAVDGAGAVWCRGRNTDGELGQGDLLPQSTLVKVPLPAPVKRLSLTHYHACAVLTDARLYCWGRGTEAQLGQNDATSRGSPVQVPGAWSEVAAGDGHTCALASDGRPWCWGRNTEGEIGQGAVTPPRYDTPREVGSAPQLVSLEPTMFATCGLDPAGGLWCWGKRQDVAGPRTLRSTTSRPHASTRMTAGRASAPRCSTCAPRSPTRARGVSARTPTQTWASATPCSAPRSPASPTASSG
ncbi:MAG: hypothetical protein IPJ65_41395 [Archangiaceae bacterium]|nr:hypothetical protein [Archangiaceae bacterium]